MTKMCDLRMYMLDAGWLPLQVDVLRGVGMCDRWWARPLTHRASRSCSEAPGKSGKPRKSSAATQPNDHMSIETLYDEPRTTSGER